MSLNSFHRFFIVVCILLCGFVSYWALKQQSAMIYPFGVGAVGLIAYFVWFIKKSKKPSPVVVGAFLLSSLLSPPAQACSVCFGLADRETVKALNNSVFFMVGITTVVLTGLTFLILHIVKLARARDSQA